MNYFYKSRDFIKQHPLFAVTILFCTGCIFSLNEVLDDVLEGDTHEIDTQILLMLRDPQDSQSPWGPLWLQEMMRDFTGLGGIGILTFLTLSAFVYLLVTKQRNMAFYLLAAAVSGTLLSNIMKTGFARPRPDLVPHDSITYMASLPSGHSLMAAVVYLTLGALLAGTQKKHSLKVYIMSLAILIAVLVGISRIYLGVHWPSDVLAGWLTGAAWASMFWILAYWNKNWRLR